jgi:hypothetical protein
VTLKLDPSNATCKKGVSECHYRYHSLRIVADIESGEMEIREYCHSVTAAFIGPTGNTYLVGLGSDPRFGINCVEA